MSEDTHDDDPANMMLRAGYIIGLAWRLNLDGDDLEMVARASRSLVNAAQRAEALVALVAASKRAEEVLALCTVREFDAPEDAHVRQLGERIGFGALMSAASKTWGEWLREQGMPPGSNFASGPCVATVERTLEELRGALAKLDAHDKEV